MAKDLEKYDICKDAKVQLLALTTLEAFLESTGEGGPTSIPTQEALALLKCEVEARVGQTELAD